MKSCYLRSKLIIALAIIMMTTSANQLHAQVYMKLADLSGFQSPSSNWRIAGDVLADLATNNKLVVQPGAGILVNQPEQGVQAHDILFFPHGDLDMELDFMMAKGSNSGIYLQGRYEIQLLDSWTTLNPKAGDNGGIYERWNDAKPEGQKGYEGYAPRQNASRAPGLWQHIKISFQAPRFNASGQKIENARMLRVELNGVLIHEDVELTGPTRGPLVNDEVATGPLRFQGDHGPVAFRNIRLTAFGKPRPELVGLKYSVYKGVFEKEPDYTKLKPVAEGKSEMLTSNITTLENEFLIHYTGVLRIKEPGEYNLGLSVPGGSGAMVIDDKPVLTAGEGRRRRGRIELAAGDHPFKILYFKTADFAKPSLGLAVSGPGIRDYVISDANVPSGEGVDPILINSPSNTILRSFMDIDTTRVTHAVSVGTPQQVHYTYDLDRGSIIQVWRGGFLDATPMWHSRGDGSSRPAGSTIKFGKPAMSLVVLNNADSPWPKDSTGTSYRPKGYKLDNSDRPTFLYQEYNTLVKDSSVVMEGNQGIRRQIVIDKPVPGLYFKLAEADKIESAAADGLYLIDDKTYYLRIDNADNSKAIIRDSNGKKQLIIPIQNKLSYSILF
jgi:hypothetical protein